jgi:ligand-binding SRPBCC domain-containing protein
VKFSHRFLVRAPVEEVADFHSRSSSLKAITPPPFVLRLDHAPSRLAEGHTMEFTMWAGPVPVRWVAQIEDVSPTGFTDRQLEGPFLRWQHRHTFMPIDPHSTEVLDDVEAEVKRHPWWGLIGTGMWAGLPALFRYRQMQTRRLLETDVRDVR